MSIKTVKRNKYIIKNNGMTLIETLITVAVISVAFTLILQMITTGSKNVTTSIWHSERVKESQLFLKMLREDLQKASDFLTIDYSQGIDNEIRFEGNEITYKCPDTINFIDPFSNSNTQVALKVAKPSNNPVNFLEFNINKIQKITATSNSSGYKIRVTYSLKDSKIYVTKTLISGTAPTNEDQEMIIPAPGKILMNEVEFVHISHNDITSNFYNPPKVIGSVINVFVRVKSLTDENKKAEFKQSIKTSVKAKAI